MINWNRSSEGHIESKCKRFVIVPEYWGRERAQSYELKDRLTGERYRVLSTQRDAKDKAESIVLKESKKYLRYNHES